MKGNKSKLDYLREKYSGAPKSKLSRSRPEQIYTKHNFDDEPQVEDGDQDPPVVVEDPEGLLKGSKRTFSKSNWVILEEAKPDADIEPSKKKRHDSDSEDEVPQNNQKLTTFNIDESGDMEPPRPKGRKLDENEIEEVTGQELGSTRYREKGGRIISKEQAQISKYEHLRKLNKEHMDKWGKGIKQIKEEQEREVFEANIAKQPLGNTEISQEIDEELKQESRFGDPMRDLIAQSKKKKEGVVVFSSKFRAAPNRYGINPGHRWDGVDRGNGFEKKFLLAQNERIAKEEEAYKWRTEEM